MRTFTIDWRQRLNGHVSAVLRNALLLAIMVIVAACEKAPITASPAERSDARIQYAEIPYPVVDTFLGEQLYDNEERIAQTIAVIMAESIQDTPRKYGAAIRDAHPKAHGCVKAQFRVENTLPGIATGVFQPGRSYEAWIRFSNSSADPQQADIIGDGRGMAVKLMGVQGKKLLEAESDATTQDFIMISHPVFIIDDPSDYEAFQREITSTKWVDKVFLPFTLGLKGLWIAHQITSKKIENPLQARYWSMVPYQLGTGAER